MKIPLAILRFIGTIIMFIAWCIACLLGTDLFEEMDSGQMRQTTNNKPQTTNHKP